VSKTREQAARAIAAAVRKADAAVYSLREREHTMRPAQYQRALTEARQQGMAAIRQARADLDTAIARERQENLREYPTHLTGEWAARQTLYATQGMALAQAGMADLAAGIRGALAAGNQVAAREYLRAGGSRLQSHLRETGGKGADYHTLQRAATSKSEAQRAAMVAGIDHYAEQTSRLDHHLNNLQDRLGNGDLDADPESRQDVARVVDLWHDTAEDAATEHGLATATAYSEAASQTGVTDL